MKAQKDIKTGKWLIQFRYTNYLGEKKKTTKRGFDTKREAEAWVREFLQRKQGDLNMRFEEFLRLYYDDISVRIRENTMETKKHIIRTKVLPYFKDKAMNDISPRNIREWQNSLMSEGYSETYLRTIYNNLNAILNYACTYYDLKSNPCMKVGSIGKNKADKMSFWTYNEAMSFLDVIISDYTSYIAFKTLYFTGIRLGELLALSPNSIDFDNHTMTVSKSYQRIKKRDVITPTKSGERRIISIPKFLTEDLHEYTSRLHGLREDERIFQTSKSTLTNAKNQGIKRGGLKQIRIHDIRHSHCAYLISLGFNLYEIGQRLGHSEMETTMIYAHLYPDQQKKLADKIDQDYREKFE